MKLLKASEIKKILIGVSLTDGTIDLKNQRFGFYSKQEEYARYIYNTLSQITGMGVKFQVVNDKRAYKGFRVWTRKHAYWKNLGDKVYNGRKQLTPYIVNRIDEECLAHMWMCDGYLATTKNRKSNKAQNVGWWCLEAFPLEELELFQKKLQKMGIESSLVSVRWGYGWRVRVGGENLQLMISKMYPYILDCFLYKTPLFYKTLESVNMELPNAEQYIHLYGSIEDIVRHPLKKGRT